VHLCPFIRHPLTRFSPLRYDVVDSGSADGPIIKSFEKVLPDLRFHDQSFIQPVTSIQDFVENKINRV